MNQTKKPEKNFLKCCKVCNIWISGKDMIKHMKGKKHLKITNKKELMDEAQSRCNNKGVYITGISSAMDNTKIVEYFQKFGKVMAIHRYHDDNKVLLQFRKGYQAEMVLSNTSHEIEGVSVATHPRKTALRYSKSDYSCVQMSEFKKALRDFVSTNPGISIEEQIHGLTAILQITIEEQHQQSQILSSLEEWLSLEFPSCRFHLLGSSVSGLAFHKDSDLDISLETSPDEDLAEENKINSIAILRRACDVIRTHPNVWGPGMVIITQARVPVSKFSHIPSGINCDLTCNNIIGVQNSKLLYSLQKFDDRIRPFLYVLKFWAKCHRLVSATESTLSSYGLNLLAVYYLQQCQPPILPSIESLQNEVPEAERVYCSGWNVSFRIPFVSKTDTGSKTVISLLQGFFTFYRQFDAQEAIICPLMGKAIPKTEFYDSLNAIDTADKDCVRSKKKPMKISLLSVQDPFELNFNVTSRFRDFELFQSLCESAEKVCLAFCEEAGKTDNPSLVQLFNKPLKVKCKTAEKVQN